MLTKKQHVWPSPRPPLPQRTPRGKECGLHALTHKRFYRQHADHTCTTTSHHHASSPGELQRVTGAAVPVATALDAVSSLGTSPAPSSPPALPACPLRGAARSSRHSPLCCFQFGYLLLASLSAVASAVASVEASVVVSDARRDGRNERRPQQTTDVASLSAVVATMDATNDG